MPPSLSRATALGSLASQRSSILGWGLLPLRRDLDCETRTAQIQGISEHSGGSLLMLTQAVYQKQPSLFVTQPPQPVPWSMLSTHTTNVGPALLPSGEVASAGSGETQLGPGSQGLCSSDLAPAPVLNKAEQQLLERRSTCSHLALAQQLQLHLHLLPRWQLAAHPKERNCVYVRSSSSTKVTGHSQAVKVCPPQGHPCKTTIGNDYT